MKKIRKSKKNEIEIIEKDGMLWTTSVNITENLKLKHKNVLQKKENLEYPDEFPNFSRLNFQPSDYIDSRGKVRKMYLISKDGASFLIPKLRGKEAAKWHIKYINEFNRRGKIIENFMERYIVDPKKFWDDPKWITDRTDGKITRKKETDTIKIFIKYAREQGSNSPENYYMNFSKMENKHLFFLEKHIKLPNLRDCLNSNQLGHLREADHIVERSIQQGMKEKMFYRDIYKFAKKNIISFVALSGRTPVLPIIDLLPEPPKQITAH